MATKQITATLNDGDGHTADVTASAVWSTSDSNVATVSTGLITPVGAGTCDITATLDSLSADVAVTVPVPDET